MSTLLRPGPESVTDVFDPARPPALTVESGERLTVEVLDARGYLERPAHAGAAAPVLLEPRRGHCLAGPIAVRGAEPGDVLAVTLHSVRTSGWGWTAAGFPSPLNSRLDATTFVQLLWDIDDEAGTATNQLGFTVDTAPFLGVIGTTPAAPGEHSTTPPRPGHGGNVDCRSLVAGSTLFLPVHVPGALLCLGDGHAAQGDGEVCGTAVECGTTTELSIAVVADPALPSVHATTPTERITFGFDADLNAATDAALGDMVTWVAAEHGLDRSTALALLSACVDLRVTQVANETWGVHAVLRHDALRRNESA
ncbi:acetamidase/formamidase family protein [Kineococcus sp. SYSU DK003]|uniref:acetamidase/formamidase family protein n=1 Tax=Kineococcus sp. SYSU DK003 TaxID=3383124 RepID=UPI003D7DEBA5